jgi:hypothetical protein
MTSSFVNPDHEQTLIGRALNTAVRTTKVTDKFQEPLYLVLELLRAGVCHGDRWGGADTEVLSGGPSFGTGRCLLVFRLSYYAGHKGSLLAVNRRRADQIRPRDGQRASRYAMSQRCAPIVQGE